MNRNAPPDPSQRRGEAPWHHHRTDRSFNRHDNWFFRTREGIDAGPYPTHERAEIAASQLAIMLDGITDMEITAQFIREFMLLKMI
jgi:uncharacterized protein DUF6316